MTLRSGFLTRRSPLEGWRREEITQRERINDCRERDVESKRERVVIEKEGHVRSSQEFVSLERDQRSKTTLPEERSSSLP